MRTMFSFCSRLSSGFPIGPAFFAANRVWIFLLIGAKCARSAADSADFRLQRSGQIHMEGAHTGARRGT
jgi:hypothetical protein